MIAIPMLMHYYPGYTFSTLMDEFAVTVISLINSMYRLKALDSMTTIGELTTAQSEPKHRDEVLRQLEKEAEGLDGILREVKVIKP